jgi:signal transduction histidine kinase
MEKDMKLTIGMKLMLIGFIMLASIAATSAVGLKSIDKVVKNGKSVLDEFKLIDVVHELRISFAKVLMPVNDYLIHGNAEEKDNFETLIKALKQQMAVVNKEIIKHRLLIGDERGKEKVLANVEKDILEIESIARQILSVSAPAGDPESAAMSEEMDAIADKVIDDLNTLIGQSKDDANKATQKSDATEGSIVKTTAVVGTLIVLAATIGGFLFVRGITGQIGQLLRAVQKISRGNLTARVEVRSKDEIGGLAVSFNQMAEDLEIAHTTIQATQEQLAQAEKLNAVGRLASGVAHEVKNPLGIIRQGIDYLEDKLPPSEKDVFEVFQMMKSNIDRTDRIVRLLLDFSRASKLEKRLEDANSILETSLTLVSYKVNEGNVEVVKEFEKDLPKISVDKGRLEQVFINLFLNAVDAMPKGGKISVRSYLTQLTRLSSGIGRRSEDHFSLGEKAVMIEVEDTGEGIPEENLKKVFDPFFTTKTGRGSGLGLSVTKNIIVMHKGIIEIKSKVGKGTKISVALKIPNGGQDDV